MRGLALLLLLLGLVASASAHMKWVYPEPRDDSAGNKDGPCGPTKAGDGKRTELEPGVHQFVSIETINHPLAPVRVALNWGEDDYLFFNGWVLVNHYPHEGGTIAFQYQIEVELPDIDCPDCTLQLVQVMTDKPQVQCSGMYPEDWVSYYSCADVSIKGKIKPERFKHKDLPTPAGWPTGAFGQSSGTFVEQACPNGVAGNCQVLQDIPAKVETAQDLDPTDPAVGCPEPKYSKSDGPGKGKGKFPVLEVGIGLVAVGGAVAYAVTRNNQADDYDSKLVAAGKQGFGQDAYSSASSAGRSAYTQKSGMSRSSGGNRSHGSGGGRRTNSRGSRGGRAKRSGSGGARR